MLQNIKELFLKFSQDEFFKDFYFTGGTALSYYLNHRISYDIDFTSTKKLNTNKLKSLSIKYDAKFIPDTNASTFRINTGEDIQNFKMSFNFDGIKVEFFYPNDEIIEEILKKYKSNSVKIFENIYILPITAIANLKLVALFKRDKIRDLFDIFVLLEKDILDIKSIERFCSIYYNKTFVEFVESFTDDGSESLDFSKENQYYELFANEKDKLNLIKQKLTQTFVKKSLQ